MNVSARERRLLTLLGLVAGLGLLRLVWVAATPPAAEELERERLAAEARRRQAEAAAQRAAVPRPPEVTLSYLGSFGPDGRRIAVFTASDGRSVINALEGDVIEGKFVVVKIGFESVDLGFVGFPDAAPRRLAPSR